MHLFIILLLFCGLLGYMLGRFNFNADHNLFMRQIDLNMQLQRLIQQASIASQKKPCLLESWEGHLDNNINAPVNIKREAPIGSVNGQPLTRTRITVGLGGVIQETRIEGN